MTKNDLHPIVQNILNRAVKLGVIDSAEAYAMGSENGYLESKTVDAIIDAAYTNSREIHKELCELADAYYASTAADEPTTNDMPF